MSKRIIARLDIKGPNLVKGAQLEGLRALGRVEPFARQYYEQGADELIYQDVVASLYGRNSLLEMIEKVSREIFIPLTVGGGLRNLEDIRMALTVGADKVALNTAAISDPKFIAMSARQFGASTIVVAIEAKKMSDGSYQAFTDNGREPSGKEVVQWAIQAAELGAGEIMLTSIDRDGTGMGFDLELIKAVESAVSVSVVASGGAGNINHIHQAFSMGKVDAVCIASLFHFHYLDKVLKKEVSTEGNFDFVSQQRQHSRIAACSLEELRNQLDSTLTRSLFKSTNSPVTVKSDAPLVAVVDYGMGNLFSVRSACEHAGLRTILCNKPDQLKMVDAIILPGVGAFADAMKVLKRTGLDKALYIAAKQGMPLFGICLGMQLLMEKSNENGIVDGLGIISGVVDYLGEPCEDSRLLNVPQIGWNSIHQVRPWDNTLLETTLDGAFMYFVHSYRIILKFAQDELCQTLYGNVQFSSGVCRDNVIGLQFHPERSGSEGLSVYHCFARWLMKRRDVE